MNRITPAEEADYLPGTAGIFDDEDERVRSAKRAVAALDPWERRLFVAYMETGSLSELSRLLQVSKSTLHYRLHKVIEKVKEKAKQ